MYPYQTLSFSSFSVGLPISQTVEVGTTSAAGPYTSTWGFNNGYNLTANSISITGLTSLASSLSGTSSSVTHPVYSFDAPTNLTFTISANGLLVMLQLEHRLILGAKKYGMENQTHQL